MSGLGDLADLARQTWREEAACMASGVEFVDVTPTTGQYLIETYCRGCAVIVACRRQGDAEAPHAWPTVMGGRRYDKREPAEGWPDEGEVA